MSSILQDKTGRMTKYFPSQNANAHSYIESTKSNKITSSLSIVNKKLTKHIIQGIGFNYMMGVTINLFLEIKANYQSKGIIYPINMAKDCLFAR